MSVEEMVCRVAGWRTCRKPILREAVCLLMAVGEMQTSNVTMPTDGVFDSQLTADRHKVIHDVSREMKLLAELSA